MTASNSEMVERVAKAIDGRGWDQNCTATEGVKDALRGWALATAHFAIAAMREPTQQMREAARDQESATDGYSTATAYYQAMIDAALKGGE